MNLGWKLFWFAGAVAWGTRSLAAPMDSAPLLFYSQDNVHFTPFEAMQSRQKVREYYNYYHKSGHPQFGNAHNTGTAAVYWDDKRDALSLILISGAPPRRGRTGDSGEVTYRFRSLPSTTYLALADDRTKFHYTSGDEQTKAIFNYRDGTDGLVFAGLSGVDSFKMRIQVSTHRGMRSWRLVDGDVTDDGGFVGLDLSKPLWIRATGLASPLPPPPVPPVDGSSDGGTTNPLPEPGMGLWLIAACTLLTRRRRG